MLTTRQTRPATRPRVRIRPGGRRGRCVVTAAPAQMHSRLQRCLSDGLLSPAAGAAEDAKGSIKEGADKVAGKADVSLSQPLLSCSLLCLLPFFLRPFPTHLACIPLCLIPAGCCCAVACYHLRWTVRYVIPVAEFFCYGFSAGRQEGCEEEPVSSSRLILSAAGGGVVYPNTGGSLHTSGTRTMPLATFSQRFLLQSCAALISICVGEH